MKTGKTPIGTIVSANGKYWKILHFWGHVYGATPCDKEGKLTGDPTHLPVSAVDEIEEGPNKFPSPDIKEVQDKWRYDQSPEGRAATDAFRVKYINTKLRVKDLKDQIALAQEEIAEIEERLKKHVWPKYPSSG